MDEIVQKLREHTGDPEGDFNTAFFLSGNGKVNKVYIMEFEYRKKNSKGEFQKKKSSFSMAIKYNPFTGKKLEEDPKPKNEQPPSTNTVVELP